MANIHIKRKHNLTREEARKRVDEIAKALKKEFDADYTWQGDALQFKRSGATGFIKLDEESIELKIKLGMMLTPVKGKIESAIRDKLDVALLDQQDTKFT
jgi:putative polyhydroxyalkanoate system protein